MERARTEHERWRAGPVAERLWQRGQGTTLLLSQARHAQTVILALLRARGIDKPVIWLPAFYGYNTLAPLLASPAHLHYYAMTPELSPDWQSLEVEASQSGPPDLLVLVHYYGTEADGEEARRFADRHGALLFEDAAHAMLPAAGIGRYGHLACYSPRKYYDTFDGAVLVANSAELTATLEAVAPAIPTRAAPRAIFRYKAWADRHLPWRRQHGPLPPRSFDRDWDMRPKASPDVWMSRAASRTIERLGEAGAEAIRAREVADTAAIERYVEAVTPLRALGRIPEVAPYLVGFRGRDREETEAAYDLLRGAGANVGTWPSLPKVVRHNPERYGAALELRNTILRVIPRFSDRRGALDFIGRLPERPA